MKIGIAITARLKSTRLPYKLLLDLDGRNVIERIIDRCKKVHNVSEIILCTSTNPQDKPLVDIAQANNIYYYNGDEDDVLQRLLTAAKLYDLDYIVSLTADNPLFSIYHTNLVVDMMKNHNKDFVKIAGLPFGAFVYGLKTKALEVVCKIKNVIDTEIWGILIDRPDIFDVGVIEVNGLYNNPGIRLTLDYEEDYRLLQNLYMNIPFTSCLDLLSVVVYLDQNKQLLEINNKCIQKSIDKKTKDKIDTYYLNNIDNILQIKKEVYNQ